MKSELPSHTSIPVLHLTISFQHQYSLVMPLKTRREGELFSVDRPKPMSNDNLK